jgi:hypothetical protein
VSTLRLGAHAGSPLAGIVEALVKQLALGRLANGRLVVMMPRVEQAIRQTMEHPAAVGLDPHYLHPIMVQIGRQIKDPPRFGRSFRSLHHSIP